jgi:hypothetical protein
LTISISALHVPVASAQGPAAPVTSQVYGTWAWPYYNNGWNSWGSNNWWGNNSWNWWGNNSWGNNWWGNNWWGNSWYNWYSPYSAAAYAFPYGLHASNSPYNYQNVYWTGYTTYGYPASSVNVTPGTASPAWIFCSVPGRGPIWVDANNIPAGVAC